MPNWKKIIVSGSDASLNSLVVTSGVTITGSLNVSGSTTQVGNNTLLGNTLLTGSITISGSFGPGSPGSSVRIYGNTRHDGYITFNPVSTNIDTSISASYIYVSGSTNDLYFSQNGSGYSNVTRLRWLEGNLYTGLLNGGILSTASSTVYQVGSGSGIIVNLNASLNDNPYPTIKYLNWGNLSASIAPLTGSYQQAFVAIDDNATIYAQGLPFSNGQFDTLINIGNVLFQNQSTINGVKTQPSVAYGFEQAQNTFNRAFGPLKLSGYTLVPSGSSTGSLVVGSGTAYAPGANYIVNPNEPYYASDSGTNTSKIFRYYQSGSTWVYLSNAGAGYPTIDPTQYSNNGALTAVPGTGANRQWTIQRVFWFPNSVAKAIVVYYGNASYATEVEAIANISVENFVEAPNTAANAIYLGSIIVRNNANFTNSATYKIIPGGLFRQVGGSGGGGSIVTQTLAGLSDVSLTTPTDYQALVYDFSIAKWINASNISASITGNAATATSSSYATSALSSSFATTAISASFATSASFAISSSRAVTSSFAITASYVTGSIYTSTNPALSASFATTSISASFATSASFAITASFATSALSSSFATSAISSSFATTALSSSFASTASYVANDIITASISSNTITFTKGNGTTFPITVATGSGTVSSVSTSGNVNGITLTGGPITTTGTITLGGTLSNVQSSQLATSSLMIGSTNIALGATASSLTGLTAVTSTAFTGSLFGTSSWATNATTATNATNVAVTDTTTGTGPYYIAFTDGTTGNRAVRVDSTALTFNATTNTLTNATFSGSLIGTASFASSSISASFASTASYVANSLITASVSSNTITFTKGDGTTFPITVATGSGAATSAFPFTGSAIITGSLTVTGSVNSTGGYTGSLFGTASWATNVVNNGVTSVATAGTVSGITLTGGTITSTGTITLGGSISGLTNANLSGTAGITNANLANSSLMVGATSIALGATASSLTGLTSVTSTAFTGSLLGTASFATSALSSSFATTASFASSALSSSFATSAISSSFATTASFALSTVQPTSGKVIYVDATSPNATNTRGSLSKYNLTYPFATIQAAVNAAASGDSLWVYPGTYNESVIIGLSGSIAINMLLYSGVTINGGSSYAILSGTGSAQCALNLDMMPNSIVRNTGNASDPSGSAVIQKGVSNNGVNITGVGNPLAKSVGAGPDYTTGNPSIISTNAYCLYNFGLADFNGEKASGVTFYSQNSIPIAAANGTMVFENCVMSAPSNYGVFGTGQVLINCLVVSNRTCVYSSNSHFAHLINCDLYSTTEYGVFGTNNIGGRVIVNDCRINSFSQSIQMNSNNTNPTRYEICNNVMGSRNLASSTMVSIADTNVNSTGLFSNNVVNKSTVTIPTTISEFNTYVTNDVSGSIPNIII